MRPFVLHRASSPDEAIGLAARSGGARFLAGGTTLVDLMKLGLEQPHTLIDISEIGGLDEISVDRNGNLRIGALARMSDVADDPAVRSGWPALSEALWKGASAQLRNMATIGGNILQRTRCQYFRDIAFPHCNKRSPGSGCAALEGLNRENALLGASQQCIALHPSDLCIALAAFDARIEILSAEGTRVANFSSFHKLPGDTPDIEHDLASGEMITAVTIPCSAAARRSLYVKVRDRQSYQFAVTSVAAAVELDHAGLIRDIRLALGGVATKPWRAAEAERYLVGRPIHEETAFEAGRLAMLDAAPRRHNAFKVPLMQRSIVEAMLQLSRMEQPNGA